MDLLDAARGCSELNANPSKWSLNKSKIYLTHELYETFECPNYDYSVCWALSGTFTGWLPPHSARSPSQIDKRMQYVCTFNP